MNTENNLYQKICSFNNILLASKKARKGKRFTKSTSVFEVELEKEIIRIMRELESQEYKFGKYKEFLIYEPKTRMISAAPYRDRVVHHSVCNIIEPLFEKTFIFDSYANRKGKGTHKAILRYQKYCRKYAYVLKCDIKKYFPSIDHEILKSLIRHKIKCLKSLALIDLIIDNSNIQERNVDYFKGDDLFTPFERRTGLPIGNLTSQFFANIYLNPLDHFIKEKLKIPAYLRYVDDFVLFSDSKELLNNAKRSIVDFLDSYRLVLHKNKSIIYKTNNGVLFLGHKIYPDHRLLNKNNVIRFKSKLKKQLEQNNLNLLDINKLKNSVQSWVAHASFSDTFRLRKKIFSEYKFLKV